MTVPEREFDHIGQIVGFLLSSTEPGTRWFRGNGCHTHSLRPSLYRKLTDTSPTNILSVEQRLLTRFRQRSLPLWPEGYPQTPWEHLFAMQHYGVPTRLLDWSENAVAALYFAGDFEPSTCDCGGECKATIWILDPILLNKHNPRLQGMPEAILTSAEDTADNWKPGITESRFAPLPIALYGTHNSNRIAAQQGAFTAAGKDDVALEETSLGETDGVLQKLTIKADHASILNQLRLLGITRSTVYPDLPSLAHDIAKEEIQ